MKKSLFQKLTFVLVAFFLLTFTLSFFNKGLVKAKAVENEITVFSWEDYIDEELLTEFEDEFGIKVNYYTFATNEEMYNELKKAPDKVDLICPSEYMIMKMVDEGLIKKYTMPDSYANYGSSYIKKVFDGIKVGENGAEKLSDYAIGYMWGTMGFLYNMDNVDAEDLKHWNGIWNEKYKNKTTIKDSVRDTYIMVLGYVYEQELLALDKTDKTAYNNALTAIFNSTDDVSIEKVGTALAELKDYIYGYEVDSGKSDLLTGKIDINFAWSGDAVYTMDLGDEAGLNIGYIVPEEGSNVWFDGWVMPNGANETNAGKFLDFISKPENAVRNMEYIGYTSCVAGDEVFDNAVSWYSAESEVISATEYAELDAEEQAEYGLYDGEYYCAIDVDENENNIYGILTNDGAGVYLKTFTLDGGVMGNIGSEEVFAVDLKYFFDETDTTGKYVIYTTEMGRQLFAQYADEETINRCAVMNNFDDATLEKINAMWNREKLITLPTYVLIIIGVLIVLMVVAFILYKYKDKLFVKKIPDADKPKTKNGLKVIKKEML
ncbi:MAG: extracellular solute-binding protein [Clostridia bacterium]|nr:extracellular solute-binding protein [Clostridia bacterium]